jgi:tRNA G18 (ribose-2'-O)-methylase SpoU
MNQITSADNSKYKFWRSLLSSKGLKAEKHCLVSGTKILSEIVDRSLAEQASEWACELVPPHGLPLHPKLPAFQLTQELFSELDELGTNSNLVVLKIPEIPVWKPTEKTGLHLLLPLGDPSNLGACLRVAEAFSVSSVILLKESAHPFLPKAIKASSGSGFRVPLRSGPSLRDLQISPLWALDLKGEKLNEVHWPQLVYLLIGEEGPGIPSSLKISKSLQIPTQGVESLNASVAAGIALYEYSNKRK